jgi:hypothetical protein
MKHAVLTMILGLVLLTGCKHASEKQSPALSWGQPQVIYVFAENAVWDQLEKPLRASLESTFLTTQEELWFTLKHVPADQFDTYFKYNNILFLYAGDGNGDATDRAGALLGSQVNGMPADSAAVFTRDNLWCRDQLIVFTAAGSTKELVSYAPRAADFLFKLFSDRFRQRMATVAFQQRLRPQSELKGLPWTASIPYGYNPFRKDSASGFTSYLKRITDHPDRYFAVYRAEYDGKTDLLPWAIQTRNRIIGRFYEGDSISAAGIRSGEIALGGRNTFCMWGRWQNTKYYVGGAFECYLVRDPGSRYVYFVDNSVFFPDDNKLPALLELDGISQTFRLR